MTPAHVAMSPMGLPLTPDSHTINQLEANGLQEVCRITDPHTDVMLLCHPELVVPGKGCIHQNCIKPVPPGYRY